MKLILLALITSQIATSSLFLSLQRKNDECDEWLEKTIGDAKKV